MRSLLPLLLLAASLSSCCTSHVGPYQRPTELAAPSHQQERSLLVDAVQEAKCACALSIWENTTGQWRCTTCKRVATY